MNTAVKSAAESALVALFAAAVCLWFLISGATGEEEPSVARMALLGIGLACALVAHWAFMANVIKRSGRSLMPWMLAVILTTPVGTAALLALLASEDKPQQAG